MHIISNTWRRVSTQLSPVPQQSRARGYWLQQWLLSGVLPAPYETHGSREHRRTRLLSGVPSERRPGGHAGKKELPNQRPLSYKYQHDRSRRLPELSHSQVVVVFIIKSVVTGQTPVTLELRNTPGRKHKQTTRRTRIYHSWRNSCLRQKHVQSEIGRQPTMCQVIRLTIRAWKNRLYRLPPYHVYIWRSTYHYAYASQAQVNWEIETKKM